MLIPMLWSASITLGMAKSLNTMIGNQSEIEHVDDPIAIGPSSIFLTALSVIIGGTLGAMGIRGILALVLLIFFILAGGDGSALDGIFDLIGIKGLVMICAGLMSIGFYWLSVYVLAKDYKNRTALKSVLSIFMLVVNVVLLVLVIVRIIMILFFGFPILYITEFA